MSDQAVMCDETVMEKSGHTRTAVQQVMLGTILGNAGQAKETLRFILEAGYDGIELNGFMIRRMPPSVRLLTKFAGMPVGKSGSLDWLPIIRESGLEVPSIHEDLGTIENNFSSVVKEAKDFCTDTVVITGMYRFDYSSMEELTSLCNRLNESGKKLAGEGIALLYHNHNAEFRKVQGYEQFLTGRVGRETQRVKSGHSMYAVNPDHKMHSVNPGRKMKFGKVEYTSSDCPAFPWEEKTAFDFLLEQTDPRYVNFEFDSYWAAEAGADPLFIMKKLGNRMKLYHINDRGTRLAGKSMTPILKSDSMELGYGNMNLISLLNQAKNNGARAVILESHKNWAEKSPVRSLQISAEFLKEFI
ncbi:MAG TPA: sugar phosphate isomerase/epimerase [Lachnospiraceae bacterium]|nr:sugar phosphate isomerase/epimerase [Lachnospiraceae bacterium]